MLLGSAPRPPALRDLARIRLLATVFSNADPRWRKDAPRPPDEDGDLDIGISDADERATAVPEHQFEAARHRTIAVMADLEAFADRRVGMQLAGLPKERQVEQAKYARRLDAKRHYTLCSRDGHDLVYVMEDSPTVIADAMSAYAELHLGDERQAAAAPGKDARYVSSDDGAGSSERATHYWAYWHNKVARSEAATLYASADLRSGAMQSGTQLPHATELLYSLGFFLFAAWEFLALLQPVAVDLYQDAAWSRARFDPVQQLVASPLCPFPGKHRKLTRHTCMQNSVHWIWSGLALLWNQTVDAHRDGQDAKFGWLAETVAGRFSGGEMFLPQLGIVIPLQPGDLLLIRSALLEHCVLPFEGERYAVVAFRHQSTLLCKRLKVEKLLDARVQSRVDSEAWISQRERVAQAERSSGRDEGM
ncbi:hypothetical protein Rhopal_006422-T1 [Rhodotorula paludigena]|uniref:Uncharacterized protein n=1 Tax=Rhodotorula paludigena TaxID=86838 RepID=A0AAV5GS87_9BASI|nr:hypothetical protein Rhopal_006422-T1 [Rhodotorula paludigena]